MILANNPKAIKSFLSTIPIRKVCGIGAVTEQLLKALDIHTCKDLWRKRAIISLLFKPATYRSLLGISMGTGGMMFRDSFGSESDSGRKSLSCERTFTGTSDLGFLQNLCKRLSSEVEKDLKSAGLTAKTITLKIKTVEYDVKTRARSISERTDSADTIFANAWKIYMTYVHEISDLTIRLMGVRVSNLEERDSDSVQNTLDKFFISGSTQQSLPSNSSISCIGSNSTSSSIEPVDCNIQKESISINCPVCDKSISAETLSEAERLMDIHVDDCLCKNTIKEIRNEVPQSSTRSSLGVAGSSSGSPPSKKRSAGSTILNNSKKVKKMSGLGLGLTIDAFFQKK